MPSVRAQVEIGFDGRIIIEDLTTTIDDVVKNPTVIIARKLILAVGIASGWSYESEDAQTSDELRETFEDFETPMIRSGLHAAIHKGWKVYQLEYTEESGLRRIKKMRGLNYKYIDPIFDMASGDFLGVIQTDVNTSKERRINWPDVVLINFDETMTGRLADPMLKATVDPHKWWRDTNLTANRYDRKLAGGFIIVHYPVGSTQYNGVPTDNKTIADALLTALQGVGTASIPHAVADTLDGLEDSSLKDEWRIEVIQASGGEQGNFVDRLKYLDALVLRTLGWTERSLTEGNFGTKAEAGEHADMALLNMHMMHRHLTEEFNKELVRPLCKFNYGDDRRCHLKANELSDAKKQLFRGVLSELMTNPAIGLEIAESIDTNSVLDTLGIPYNSEEPDYDRPNTGQDTEQDTGQDTGQDPDPGAGSDSKPSSTGKFTPIKVAIE